MSASNTMQKNQAILQAMNTQLRDHPGVAKEPEWVMEILQGTDTYLTKSDDKGKTTNGLINLANCSPIYHHEIALARTFAKESLTNDLVPGGLCAQELKIVAPFSSINPTVHLSFSQNTIIASLTLARLATVTQGPAPAGEAPISCTTKYTFKHLYITGLVSRYDLICLSLRYTDIHYTKHSVDPKTGGHNGSAVVAYHNLANSAAAE